MRRTLFSLAIVTMALTLSRTPAIGQDRVEDDASQKQDRATTDEAPPEPSPDGGREEDTDVADPGGARDATDRDQDGQRQEEQFQDSDRSDEPRRREDFSADDRSSGRPDQGDEDRRQADDRRREQESGSRDEEGFRNRDRDRDREVDRIQSADDLKVQLNSVENGLELTQINEESTLATAGFRRGDVILSAQGRPLRNEYDFVRWYRAVPYGARIPVIVLRGGRQQTVYVTNTWGYDDDYDRGYGGRQESGSAAYLGVVFDDRYPNLAIVEVVRRNTAAEAAGLRPGDTIQSINGQRVRGMQHVSQLIGDLRPGEEVDLVYSRRARTSARLGARSFGEQVSYDDYDAVRPNPQADVYQDTYGESDGMEQGRYDRDADSVWDEGPVRRAISRPFRTP